MIRVVRFISAHLPGVTRLVNSALEAAPPYWSLEEAQVMRLLKARGSPWNRQEADDTAPLSELVPPVTLVALDGETVQAMARLRIAGSTAHIDWIAGDDHEALKALVARIEMLALSADCSEVITGRALFGGGWHGVWGAWLPVRGALTQAGWKVAQRWRIYTLDSGALPVRPAPPIPTFKLGWHMNRAAGEWIARGFADGEEVGACVGWALPGILDDHPHHNQWITLEHVVVEPPQYRRCGIAATLIHEQMRFQARRGVTQALVVLPEENIPARRLVDSLCGSHAGDSLTFRLSLTGKSV